ncbi:RES family NAD+ phosphorylase [Bradyrhizobium sp. LB5.2]|uniref:RES family NAD+ phosphorylase n=1 Tax=Bradyrhizobium sp. LB5.2 TaxID=3156329 RepID=UPI00339257F7
MQFNHQQTTDINMSQWFEDDLHLIERTINVGFFYYGPRLWMVGEVEPLKALESEETRKAVLERILKGYPVKILRPGESFYRLRVGPAAPENGAEYDSPPKPSDDPGRLDSVDLRVMYGSQDLQVCIHECRVTADDDVFVATLAPKQDLKLLDLTELLTEEQVTEFESLDMAVHMLFLAGKHSYPIAREIALAAQRGGFDGVLYPSYFSMLRSGGIPFETLTGISHRRIPKFAGRERAKIIPNIAIFGRPISEKKVEVTSINRLMLARVEYEVRFGPVGYQLSCTRFC